MISMKSFLPAAGLAFAVLTFGAAASAQDAPAKTNPDKIEKKERIERRAERSSMRGARGMRGMRRMGGPGRMLRGMHQLELTDAQKGQIKLLMETQRAANKPLMEEMHTLMMQRRDGTITDADKVRIDDIRTGMKASGDQLRATVLGLLTPEQNQKLEQMKAERKERMELRKQRFQEKRQMMKEKRMLKGEQKPSEPVVKQP